MKRSILSFLALLTMSVAVAQIDVAISPPRLELNLPAGGTATEQIMLINQGSAEQMTVQFEDFTLTPAGEVLFLPAQSVETSLCPYVTVLPSAFDLQAGQSTEVTVQASLPADAEGLYSCVAFFRTAPKPRNEGGVQVLFSGQIGLTIYATAVGTERTEGAVSELEVSPGSARFVFENRGNTLLRPEGTLSVMDAGGKTLTSIPVEEFPVLPGGYRETTAELPPLASGQYAVFVLLEAGQQRFAAEGVLDVP